MFHNETDAVNADFVPTPEGRILSEVRRQVKQEVFSLLDLQLIIIIALSVYLCRTK